MSHEFGELAPCISVDQLLKGYSNNIIVKSWGVPATLFQYGQSLFTNSSPEMFHGPYFCVAWLH